MDGHKTQIAARAYLFDDLTQITRHGTRRARFWRSSQATLRSAGATASLTDGSRAHRLGTLAPAPGRPLARDLTQDSDAQGFQIRSIALMLLPFAVIVLVLWLLLADEGAAALRVALIAVAGALVIAAGRTPGLLAMGTAAAIVVLVVAPAENHVQRSRTFFGVSTVTR